MSSSSDVSRLLSGLRERLSAFERAHADAVSQHQSADATGSSTQSASPEAGPYAPASEQDFWAAPRQLYSAAAELEEFEAAEEDAEEEEVPDPSHFDASELGDSAEARRLLSILCAPVRLPAPAPQDGFSEAEPTPAREPLLWDSLQGSEDRETASETEVRSSNFGRPGAELRQTDIAASHADGENAGKENASAASWDRDGEEEGLPQNGVVEEGARDLSNARVDSSWGLGQHQAAADEAAGPRHVASQDTDIPDAAADIEWQVQQTRVRSHDVSTKSTEDMEPLDDMLQADQFEAADEDARAETVPISDQRLLQAGIVGVPNSGKSTLTNALVGHKVTQPKPMFFHIPSSGLFLHLSPLKLICMVARRTTS